MEHQLPATSVIPSCKPHQADMDLDSLRGSGETFNVTARPKGPLRQADFYGEVVLRLITGASRGIGLETALHFARAGASLMIVARKQEVLDASKDSDTILRERPSAQVLGRRSK
jgi:hypothetical protein